MDPVTFSIIRHRLFRVIEEAVITLKHVSGSAITNEGHDLMVSLYQADGSLLMGGVGFLHHLTSAAEACKAIIERRSSATISGLRTMLRIVSQTSCRSSPRSTSLMPGEEKPSVNMSCASGANPPGFMAPISDT